MVYLENIDDYNLKISQGGSVSQIRPKITLEARKDETGRLWVENVYSKEAIIISKPVGEVSYDGTVYGLVDDLVDALNESLGSKVNPFVKIPDGFSHPMLPDLIIKMDNGVASIENYTIDSFKSEFETIVPKYMDAINGSDSNDGNTEISPYKTQGKLESNITGVNTVYYKNGNYAKSGSLSILSRNIHLIGEEDNKICIFRGYEGSALAWIDEGGGVYSAPYTYSVGKISDTSKKDEFGTSVLFDKKESILDVESESNSYYIDTVNDKIYVHTFDDRTPDNDICISIATISSGPGYDIYLENINIPYGIGITGSDESGKVVCAKNCRFFAAVANGVNILGSNVKAWFENCVAENNYKDGFNYHQSGNTKHAVVEYNCIGRKSGIGNNDGINNGTTSHEDTVKLAINGKYYDTEGPCIHDIDNSKSFYVNCVAEESVASDSNKRSAFAVGNAEGDTSEIWLYKCTGGSETTFGAENRVPATAKIYVSKSTITNVKEGTVLETY